MSKQKKQRFHVEENESIDQCLKRMEAQGYMPVRRMEEPIFEEITNNGRKEIVPIRQSIVFEGILK